MTNDNAVGDHVSQEGFERELVAPHAIFCKAHYIYASDEGSHKCTCWKSKLPSAEQITAHDAEVWDQAARQFIRLGWKRFLPLALLDRAMRAENPYFKDGQ